MNELTVFNKDVIPVYTNDKGQKIVLGRELHEGLKIETDYKNWFPRMCEYGFISPDDYIEFWEKGSKVIFDLAHFQTPQQAAALGYRKNHELTLEMAKHIAMIQRTPEGKAIRDKLISLETNISELSPELRLLIGMELKQKEQARAIEQMNQRLDGIRDVVALSPNSWRADTKNMIVRIAQKLGGNAYIRNVHTEIYQLVDDRAGVSLETRLTNKRRRMADEGICKSVRDKLTKVDVIADDKKLIEIYLAIVKEMAVKYGVDLADIA